MAWSFNNTTKVLTSTGATISSPDSLLAGIASIQALDTTRGYVNGYIGWINNVFISISAGSFIKFDDDSTIEWRGSTYMKLAGSTGGGVIHGYRSKLIILTSTSRIDSATSFPTNASFLSLREKTNDPNPIIIYRNTLRHDYPTILANAFPAFIQIDGLDLYHTTTTSNSLKLYFGLATNATVSNIRAYSSGSITEFQKYKTTFTNNYIESFTLASETVSGVNDIIENSPTYFQSVGFFDSFKGPIRYANFLLRNPTFLNNCWNRSTPFAFSPETYASSKFSSVYTYTNYFKYGLIALQDIKVRFSRSINTQGGTCAWTNPSGDILTTTTNANGTYIALDLLDCYREGTSRTDYQFFKFNLKARKYDYKTAGELIFTDRSFFAGNINLSAGYSEEVQMLEVPYLTLTEAQASALTGISIVANGTTTGTVTISENRTIAEIWQYYRYWISQFANFDSVDSWDFDNSTLNLGGWAFITSSSITGNLITTSTITLNTGGYISGSYTSQNGIYTHLKLPNILEGSLYAREGYGLSFYSGAGGIDMIYKYTYPVPRYIRIAKAGYLPLEIFYTPSPNVITLDNVQVVDEVYNQIGIDPTTITEFSIKFDYIDVEDIYYPGTYIRQFIWSDYIRVNAPTNETTLQRLYVWYRYYEALLVTWEDHKATGKYREIFDGFNRMSAIDKVNFTLNENFTNQVRENQFTILNESANPLKITGGTLTGITGGSVIDSESNSIFIDPNKSYIANSEFIVDKLNNIPTNTLTVPKFLALK